MPLTFQVATFTWGIVCRTGFSPSPVPFAFHVVLHRGRDRGGGHETPTAEHSSARLRSCKKLRRCAAKGAYRIAREISYAKAAFAVRSAADSCFTHGAGRGLAQPP